MNKLDLEFLFSNKFILLEPGNIGFTILLFFFRLCWSGTFLIIYILSTEIYPTVIRSKGLGLNIAIGYILLIIPGIIASFGLMFYREVCADNPKMKVTDILRKAWEMTKGHKMDLFVFGLSFFGWIILAPFTLGILSIISAIAFKVAIHC